MGADGHIRFYDQGYKCNAEAILVEDQEVWT